MRQTDSEVFGRNFNRLRTTSALTQEALAEKADLSRRYLQEIESGAKSASVPILAKLRGALDCSWDDLLRGL